ncbi:hypothetical protein MBLNU13_g07743t2 [Cladosporium sp. NU13]
MSDSTIAIIVAAVALAGTLITAGFSAWFAYWSDKHKRQRELRVFFAKYQDAILLASQDLQSRLYNIADYKITEFYSCDGRFKDNLLIYTAFVVGQYLSWVYIIRQRAQFLQYETGQTNKRITTAIDAVSDEWLSDLHGECFMLWRGDQMAIGEMMTVRDGDQLSPMGYGTFFSKWAECEPETDSVRGRDKVRSSSEKSIYRGVESADVVDLNPPAVHQRRNHPGDLPSDVAPSINIAGNSSAFERDPDRSSQNKMDGQKTQFREWFEPITSGIIHIAEEKAKAKSDVKHTASRDRAGEDAIQVPESLSAEELSGSIQAVIRSTGNIRLRAALLSTVADQTGIAISYAKDPAPFFSEDGVYDLDYSSFRQAEAHEYIAQADAGDHNQTQSPRTGTPSICAAITTFNRKGRQYLNETVGSMLAGLTDEERNELEVQLLFAHVDSTIHSDWNARWLDTLDRWGTYNVSDERLSQVQEWETAQNFYAKGVDYIYVLEKCLNETDSPYVAIFEDDIIFADGWLVKTLNALGDAQLRASSSWIYLRLFYTETSLGWQASEDFWYGHQILTFSVAMGGVLLLLLLGKWCLRPLDRRLDIFTMIVLVLVAAPAFTVLVFMMGKYNLNPLKGVERMDQYGCCTQALVFPRSQTEGLLNYLKHRGDGQTDSLIEEYADSEGLERYALAPQVVQHVGLISSRNNLAINAKSTWAFWFETQDPLKLRREHNRLVSEWEERAIGASP